MEYLIVQGVVALIFCLFIYVVWDSNQRRKIELESFDLSDVVVNLAGRKRIYTNYHDHPIILETTKSVALEEKNKNRFFIRSNYTGRIIEGTKITMEANGAFTNIQWADQPSQEEIIEQLTNLFFPQPTQYELKGTLYMITNGSRLIYHQYGIETDKEYLQFLLDFSVRLLENYSSVVALGGEAIQALIALDHNKFSLFSSRIPGLLSDIALDTKMHLGNDPSCFLCSHCLVRCSKLQVKSPKGKLIEYYGCCACGRSRDLIESEERLVAVLDNRFKQEFSKNGTMRENWFVRQQLFDFDEVEIRKATDEEIERFAVKIGNDTDNVRKPKYNQMRCTVSEDCHISDNTLRILSSIFGEVVVTLPQE